MRWPIIAAAVAMMTVAAPASAFQPVQTFLRSAIEGGGSGMYYTGSARWRGYDCTVCHQDPPGEMKLNVTFDPPLKGEYRALEQYMVTVEMTGEHLGLDAEVNENMFAAEMVDDQNRPAGFFEEIEFGSLQRVGVDVNVDGVVMGAVNRTTWQLIYNAPAKDTGRISFHIAAVDGDGASNDTSANAPPADPFGDDVFVMRSRHCEQFSTCETNFADVDPIERQSTAGHGCSAGGRADGSWHLLLLALAAIRRRRKL